MKIKLTYFKESGKYYTCGEYDSEFQYHHEQVTELIEILRTGNAPGLSGSGKEFDVLMVAGDDGVPHLLTKSLREYLDYNKRIYTKIKL